MDIALGPGSSPDPNIYYRTYKQTKTLSVTSAFQAGATGSVFNIRTMSFSKKGNFKNGVRPFPQGSSTETVSSPGPIVTRAHCAPFSDRTYSP